MLNMSILWKILVKYIDAFFNVLIELSFLYSFLFQMGNFPSLRIPFLSSKVKVLYCISVLSRASWKYFVNSIDIG